MTANSYSKVDLSTKDRITFSALRSQVLDILVILLPVSISTSKHYICLASA